MISVSGKNWEQKKTNKNSIEKLKQDYNFSDILSRLAISRKFDQTELSSINNSLKLNNPFLKNNDFEKSIELVTNSINNHENICILGDYDVDGSAATSLFKKTLFKTKSVLIVAISSTSNFLEIISLDKMSLKLKSCFNLSTKF